MSAPQQYAQQPPNYGPPAQQFYADPNQAQQYPPQQAPAQPQQDPNAQYFAQQQAPAQPPAQQPTPEPQAETGDFFGGAASISFNAANGYQRGTFRGGIVKSKVITNQTDMKTGEVKRYKNGDVMKQMVVTVQTSERSDATDDGERRLFMKGDMVRAVRSAYKPTGANDVEIGGWLYVAWVNDKPSQTSGFSAQKLYEALYARPGQPDPMAGRHQPAPIAPPQQAYQPPAPTPQQHQQAAYQAQQPPPAAPQQYQAPAPQQPQYAPAPAAQQGPPADWNPFQQ